MSTFENFYNSCKLLLLNYINDGNNYPIVIYGSGDNGKSHLINECMEDLKKCNYKWRADLSKSDLYRLEQGVVYEYISNDLTEFINRSTNVYFIDMNSLLFNNQIGHLIN